MMQNGTENGLEVLAGTTRSRRAGLGRRGLRALAFPLVSLGLVLGYTATGFAESLTFDMVQSTAAHNANCLVDATAHVTVTPENGVEVMRMKVSGMPANTGFDVFIIQLPDSPFGLSWYQGDLQTNGRGTGYATFRGRFNVETFIVAPGTGAAPVEHPTDAASNPATAPVHTYHVGLWFDSPDAAAAAGCPANVTPFNGEHTAGIQALSTRNFAPDQGPLRSLQ